MSEINKIRYNGTDYDVGGTGGDTLPINSIFEYDGDTVPEGYEKIEDKDIEIIENENGIAIKYPNGFMIIYQSYNSEVVRSNWGAWGSVYGAKLSTPPNYPVEFIEIPKVNVSLGISGGNCWLCSAIELGGMPTTKRSQGLQIVRPTTYDGNILITVYVTAIGKWK